MVMIGLIILIGTPMIPLNGLIAIAMAGVMPLMAHSEMTVQKFGEIQQKKTPLDV